MAMAESEAEYTPTHPGLDDFRRSTQYPILKQPSTRHLDIEKHYQKKISQLQPINGTLPMFLSPMFKRDQRIQQEKHSVNALKRRFGKDVPEYNKKQVSVFVKCIVK